MSLMWMPAQTTMPPRSQRAQRGRDELAGRGEDDRRVERLGPGSSASPAQVAAELERERLRRASSPARVNAKTARPCESATCATMCAAAPKP